LFAMAFSLKPRESQGADGLGIGMGDTLPHPLDPRMLARRQGGQLIGSNRGLLKY